MADRSDTIELAALNSRECPHCGANLVRKKGEIRNAWLRRKYCDQHCSARHSRKRPAEDRFNEMVNRDIGLGPNGDCHEWVGSRDAKGYGKFRHAGTTLAHRASWALTHGSVPSDMFVCHRCDNPACVKPSHLFLGTHDDNMADMVAKHRARAPRGANHYNNRLTAIQIAEIIADSRKGEDVAAMYGVSKGYVNALRRQARDTNTVERPG